jgi:hypothetical protein
MTQEIVNVALDDAFVPEGDTLHVHIQPNFSGGVASVFSSLVITTNRLVASGALTKEARKAILDGTLQALNNSLEGAEFELDEIEL